jgi:hypothetical protein
MKHEYRSDPFAPAFQGIGNWFIQLYRCSRPDGLNLPEELLFKGFKEKLKTEHVLFYFQFRFGNGFIIVDHLAIANKAGSWFD